MLNAKLKNSVLNRLNWGYITRIETVFIQSLLSVFFGWLISTKCQAKKWHFFQSYAKMSTFHQQLCLSHEVCGQKSNDIDRKKKYSHLVDFCKTLARYINLTCSQILTGCSPNPKIEFRISFYDSTKKNESCLFICCCNWSVKNLWKWNSEVVVGSGEQLLKYIVYSST